MGNIHPIRDYVPVDQCARAIVEMCQKITDVHGTWNVATGFGQSVSDLIKKLEKIMGQPIAVNIDPARVRTVERERLVAAVGKLKKAIGWAPSSDVEDILRALVIDEKLI